MAPLRDSTMIPDLPALSPRKEHYYYDPARELYAGLWCLWSAATAFLALRVWVKVSRRHGLWYDDYLLILSWVSTSASLEWPGATVTYAIHQSSTSWQRISSSPSNMPLGTRRGVGTIGCTVSSFRKRYPAVLRDHERMGVDILSCRLMWESAAFEQLTSTSVVLINVSSDGTVIGQALTKTAFAVTLLRMCHASTRSRWPWQQALLWFCILTMDGIALTKCVFQWAKICGRHDYQQWYRIQGWCLDWTFSQDFKEVGNSMSAPGGTPLHDGLVTHQFPVYNIVMDFMFAIFPWFITWPLNLKRGEKIGLCITLSLGMMYVQQLILQRPLIFDTKVPPTDCELTGLLSSQPYEHGGRTHRSCTSTTGGVSPCRLLAVYPHLFCPGVCPLAEGDLTFTDLAWHRYVARRSKPVLVLGRSGWDHHRAVYSGAQAVHQGSPYLTHIKTA